nr:uncharacterized protein LOC118879656 [Drosophila suzukii]
MPNSDRNRVQIGRKLRRSLEFIRNRGPAGMTPPVTRSQANQEEKLENISAPEGMESLREQNPEGIGSGSPGEASGLQAVGGTGAIPKSLPSEIKSGVNAALVQAQHTYQVGMSTEYEMFKQQMQQDMMQFMKDINDCMAEWRRDFVKEKAAWQASTQVRQAQGQQVGQGQIPSSGTPMPPPHGLAEQPRANPSQVPPFDPRMLQQPPPIILPGVSHHMGFPPPTSGALSEKQEINRHASEGYRQTAWSTEQEPRRWNGSHMTPPENPPGNGGAHINFNPGPDQRRSSGAVGDSAFKAGQLRKWGLSFDGSPRSMPVSEFIFRLEHLQRSYQVPWKEVLREFHVLVEGQAKEWYWMYVRSTEKQEWTYLRYALQQQFQSHRSNFEREYELRERKQKPGETIEVYIQTMLALRSRLEMPFSDFDLIKVIKMNIRDQISRIIYPIYITNMDQLRHECHDAERILATRWTRHPSNLETHRGYKDRPRIDELCPESVGEESVPGEQEEVEALARHWETNRERQPLTCWNCGTVGHPFNACESEVLKVFCFKCGLPGVRTPRCTRCQTGNGMRSLGKNEEPRSNPFAMNK